MSPCKYKILSRERTSAFAAHGYEVPPRRDLDAEVSNWAAWVEALVSCDHNIRGCVSTLYLGYRFVRQNIGVAAVMPRTFTMKNRSYGSLPVLVSPTCQARLTTQGTVSEHGRYLPCANLFQRRIAECK